MIRSRMASRRSFAPVAKSQSILKWNCTSKRSAKTVATTTRFRKNQARIFA